MFEDRITELETKSAFQEDLINELNQVVSTMRVTLDALTERYQHLQHKLIEMEQLIPDTPAQEKPPHY